MGKRNAWFTMCWKWINTAVLNTKQMHNTHMLCLMPSHANAVGPCPGQCVGPMLLHRDDLRNKFINSCDPYNIKMANTMLELVPIYVPLLSHCWRCTLANLQYTNSFIILLRTTTNAQCYDAPICFAMHRLWPLMMTDAMPWADCWTG